MQLYRICTVSLLLIPVLNAVLSAQQPHVKEIPLPKEATDVSYMKSRGDIRMVFPGDMKKAGEFYQQELLKTQWTKSTKDNLQKIFWVQTFANQNRELVVRTSNQDGGCDIRLTPKGYLWDEDFAPRPEDFPIPENAQQLKYNDLFNAIEFKHHDSPRQLVDFYASKLDPKTWRKLTEDSVDVVRESSAVIQRTSGIAKIVIYIDVEKDMSKVEINTKGMSWDQIKLANANAIKTKEAASSTSASSNANNAPRKPSKPNRGIDKLEKLPSIASVTVDGKKIPLTEIFAYELIAYGKWRTHIVATAQPVKQASLLRLLQANVPEEKWGEQWSLPSPNVVWILDEDDSLWSAHLLANSVPGSSTAVAGEAVVENGRARGKIILKPGRFFEHTYEAEISFDTMLLNPTSAPRKLLGNAPKLGNAGKIVMAGKTYSLSHVLAYEERNDNHSVFRVVLTEKPIDATKVIASLKQSGEVSMGTIGFQTQISFVFDENDIFKSMFLWCDGASVNWSGTDAIQSSVQSEGDRIRGTAKTVTKEEVFGKSCEFEVSFDTSIIRASSAK